MRIKIQVNRVSKRGDRWYSSVTGRTYATREAAVRAERSGSK